MSKFVNPADLRTIDCGDGDWVKIPNNIAYADAEAFSDSASKNKFEQTLDLLEKFIKEWNFKEEDGTPVTLSREAFKRVNLVTIIKLSEEIFSSLPESIRLKAKSSVGMPVTENEVDEFKKKGEIQSQS